MAKKHTKSIRCYNPVVIVMILFFLAFIQTPGLYGQVAAKEDTALVNKLLKDARDTAEIDIKRAIIIAERAAEISERIDYRQGIAKALLRTGGLNDNIGNNEKAIEDLQKALKICEENNITDIEGKVLNTLGGAITKKNDYKTALSYFIHALNIHRQLNDSTGMAVSYSNIGTNFMDQDNFYDAVKNYGKAIEIYQSLKSQKRSKRLALLYTNIGNVYAWHLDDPKGLSYLYQAINIFSELHDTLDMGTPFSILGTYYDKIDNYDSALYYHKKGLGVYIKKGDKKMIALEFSNIAGLYINLEKYDMAEKYYNDALPLAKETSFEGIICHIQRYLGIIYAKKHDYKKAFEMLDTAYINMDTLRTHEKSQELVEMTVRYNNSELENKNKLLQKENDIKQVKLQRKNIIEYSGFGAALLFLVIGVQMVRQNRLKTNQQKLELEQKQLLAQINPHFIFNCLNSIQQFVVQNDTMNANKYLADFALLMRQTLDNSKDGNISLRREIEYLENYLSFEHMRFEDKFTYSVRFAPDINIDTIEIPSMIIQPFVENAIRHGLINLETRTGILSISFYKKENFLYCEVDDNGIGMEEAKRLKGQTFIKYQSHGMELTQQRLALVSKMNSKDYTIKIVNKTGRNQNAEGTTIIIKFPLQA